MESEFCTIILKDENRGLTLINHRRRPRNSIFMQKKFLCAKIKESN